MESSSAYIDGYCERVAQGFWGEPLNAVTNLAFIIAAVISWRSIRGHNMPYLYVLSIILFLIGVGSFLFHTFATSWARCYGRPAYFSLRAGLPLHSQPVFLRVALGLVAGSHCVIFSLRIRSGAGHIVRDSPDRGFKRIRRYCPVDLFVRGGTMAAATGRRSRTSDRSGRSFGFHNVQGFGRAALRCESLRHPYGMAYIERRHAGVDDKSSA